MQMTSELLIAVSLYVTFMLPVFFPAKVISTRPVCWLSHNILKVVYVFHKRHAKKFQEGRLYAVASSLNPFP